MTYDVIASASACKQFSSKNKPQREGKSRTRSLIGLSSSNELRIALHFKDSAQVLYSSNSCQDHIVLPALFLVRQFLELGLKYNIKKLNDVSECNNLMTVLNGTHDLKKIHSAFLAHYRGAKRILKISKTGETKYLDSLEALINKIVPLDYDSQGFRYSVNKYDQTIIDQEEIFNLKEVFDLLEDSCVFLSNVEEMFGLDSSN